MPFRARRIRFRVYTGHWRLSVSLFQFQPAYDRRTLTYPTPRKNRVADAEKRMRMRKMEKDMSSESKTKVDSELVIPCGIVLACLQSDAMHSPTQNSVNPIVLLYNGAEMFHGFAGLVSPADHSGRGAFENPRPGIPFFFHFFSIHNLCTCTCTYRCMVFG